MLSTAADAVALYVSICRANTRPTRTTPRKLPENTLTFQQATRRSFRLQPHTLTQLVVCLIVVGHGLTNVSEVCSFSSSFWATVCPRAHTTSRSETRTKTVLTRMRPYVPNNGPVLRAYIHVSGFRGFSSLLWGILDLYES